MRSEPVTEEHYEYAARKLCCFTYNLYKKQSHYRPEQTLRIPGGLGSQILRQSAHENGKAVSPMHQMPLPPRNIPGTHFC